MRGTQTRELALAILLEYERKGVRLDGPAASKLGSSPLGRRDRALVTELVQGTVRMKKALDWALSHVTDRSLEALDDDVRWTLRLSAYQLMYLRVPDHAAVDTAVEVIRSRRGGGAANYVNAVMRSLALRKGRLEWPDRGDGTVEYLSTVYSYPEWVVGLWVEELGEEKAESICRAGNISPSLSIRCNLRRTGRDDLARRLESRGMRVERSRLAPEGLLLKGTGNVCELDEYLVGMFSVQDQGSMVAGHVLSPEPGMRVLDMCAAPGNKSNHIAELMDGQGSVLAVDVDRERLSLVRESADRLGNDIIETLCMDATEIHRAVRGRFERVLVDAPCTGLGTLARRPDARWRKKPGDVERLVPVQKRLLDEGSRLLCRGGLLVYCTCTISRAENESVVRAFLEENPSFAPVRRPSLEALYEGEFIYLFPDLHGCDGMFIAALQKTG